MTLRKPLFINSSSQPDAWLPEEMAATDSIALGALTMSGSIAMGTNRITGLGNGSASDDAATYGQLMAALGGRDASRRGKGHRLGSCVNCVNRLPGRGGAHV